MRKLRRDMLFGVAVAAATAFTGMARGQTFQSEEFTIDMDSYEPTDRNPVNDPPTGTPPNDWYDTRNDWYGVIETERQIDTNKPLPDPGAVTSRYGIVAPESGTGPFGSPAYTTAASSAVTFFTDNYADPFITNNNNGTPDWWWTNAVGDSTYYGLYLTETGFAVTAETDPILGSVWNYSTTDNIHIATVPTGVWYQLEVLFHPDVVDGSLAATLNVKDSTGAVLLGSVTQNTLFGNPDYSKLAGPNYSWFTNFDTNVDCLFVDQLGAASTPVAPPLGLAFSASVVPEPATLGLLGLSGLMALRRRRA